MTPQRYAEITRLCQSALGLSASARAAFLAAACAGDDELRAEVEALLAADAAEGSLIDAPALEVAARIYADERPSLSGRRLGHYHILRLIGAGGMGEVYLAEDARLHRKVALKLLPAAFTDDAERVRRFRQEALAASALNHPNILTVYDVGESDGRHFIVTEYVEGETLRQRLLKGRLRFGEALDVGGQAAGALEAAHRGGIIHRDIKPENIMLRPDGLVKVLDFGLAKLTEKERSPDPPSLTEPGRAMGTIKYMSPEQALGQEVDARTDLFSLGVVLYEMLGGASPFAGSSEAAVYDAILHRSPPPLGQSSPDVPAELEWVVNRALEKDREVRYQTASDLKAALLAVKRHSGSGPAVTHSPAPPARPGDKFRLPKASVVAGALAAVALGGVWLWGGLGALRSESARQPVSFTRLTAQAGEELYPSLSPDGKQLIYAGNEAGNLDIWLQRVGGKTPLNLTPDSPADDTEPAFSPDGEQIAFRSERDGGGIFLMGATGESVRRLTGDGHYPAWSPDGREVVYSVGFFSEGPNNRSVVPSELRAVNVATGATRPVTKGDAVQPHWSPHGHRVAFWGIQRGGQRDLWTVAAEGGEPVPVTDDAAVDWNPVWSPDGRWLYFSSDRGGSMNLWRVPIDERTGAVQGGAEPVTTPAAWSAYVCFSRDGQRMAYAEVDRKVNLQEVAFDPARRRSVGAPAAVTRGSNIATQQQFSNDGRWIAFASLGDRQEDLFVIRRDGAGLRQLTNDAFKDRTPRWSPDDRHIIFFSDRTGRYELWQINPDGSDLKQLTWTSGPGVQSPQWSPDGGRVLCSRQGIPPFLFDPSRPWAQQTPESLPAEGMPEGFWVTSWSADGRKLIGHSGGISTYSFATRRYERLTDSGFVPTWLNDARHALFCNKDRMYLLDTETRQVTEVLSVAPGQLESISVSRDNRFVSLSVSTTESDIWLASLESSGPAPSR
jgi:eukaryotic-like serine/threonine-protein kinase